MTNTQIRTYVDKDGEIVESDIPIRGIKTATNGDPAMKDGSIRFKLVGGPYHDMVFRVYPPFDEIRWPDRNGGWVFYELTPPIKAKDGPWTYVHNAGRDVPA